MRRAPLPAALLTLSALSLSSLSLPALAVDGVIEINHARALAGSVTPGDAPGYPVTLDHAGSYRLTSGLQQGDPNVHVIEVTADNVSIDLNGFTLQGVNSCTPDTPGGPSPVSCTNNGSGMGIFAFGRNNLSVSNGGIVGMGNGGINAQSGSISRVRLIGNGGTGLYLHLNGHFAQVSEVVASGNRSSGIVAQSNGALVDRCISESNGQRGIEVWSAHGSVSNSLARNNNNTGIRGHHVVNNHVTANGDGIVAPGALDGSLGGLISGNTVAGNTSYGLAAGTGIAYRDNVFQANNGGASQVSSGYNAGGNVCNGAACP